MLAPPNHLEVFSRDGIDRLLRRGGFVPTRWVSFSNLDRDTLRRGFQRFVLGRSAPARWLAHGLASAALLPARLVDRAGLGTSFEVYAARQ